MKQKGNQAKHFILRATAYLTLNSLAIIYRIDISILGVKGLNSDMLKFMSTFKNVQYQEDKNSC